MNKPTNELIEQCARGAATARLEIESQKLTTKPVVSHIPGNVNDKEIEKEKNT